MGFSDDSWHTLQPYLEPKVTREWIGHFSITSNPTFWSSLRTVESGTSAWSGGKGFDHRSLKSSLFPRCSHHGKTLVCKAEGQYLNSQDPQKNAVWVRHFPAILAQGSRGDLRASWLQWGTLPSHRGGEQMEKTYFQLLTSTNLSPCATPQHTQSKK